MRHGVWIVPDRAWRRARPRWSAAQELGFDHVWTSDHVVWGSLPDSAWYGATPTLTAAAGATSTIRLGLFVASANFRHPVSFVRDLQALADISGDRLLIGLGAGGDPDSRVLGTEPLSPGRRVDRLIEFTELLDRVARDDHVTARGTWFSAEDMRCHSPSIRPANPFLLAGNGPRSIRYAARAGDGWITTGPRAESMTDWFAGVATAMGHLRRELDRLDRDAATFPTYLSLDTSPLWPSTPSLSDPARYADLVGRAGELGFSDVISRWPETPHDDDGLQMVHELSEMWATR